MDPNNQKNEGKANPPATENHESSNGEIPFPSDSEQAPADTTEENLPDDDDDDEKEKE